MTKIERIAPLPDARLKLPKTHFFRYYHQNGMPAVPQGVGGAISIRLASEIEAERKAAKKAAKLAAEQAAKS